MCSTAVAIVDLPEPERPVIQIVAPLVPSAAAALLAGQLAGVEGDVLGDDRLGSAIGRLAGGADDHPGGDGEVGGRVDEDEAAGGAVEPVLVEEERRGGVDRDPADVVDLERLGLEVAVQGVDVELVAQRLDLGGDPAGRVLELVRGAGPQRRGLVEPADHRLEAAVARSAGWTGGRSCRRGRCRARRRAASSPPSAGRPGRRRRRGCRSGRSSRSCARAGPSLRRPA